MYVYSRFGKAELGGFLAHCAVAYAYHLGQVFVGGGGVVSVQDGEHVARPVYLVTARLSVEHAKATIYVAPIYACPCFRRTFLATSVLVAETFLTVGMQPVGFLGWVERTLGQYTLATWTILLFVTYDDGGTLRLTLHVTLVSSTHIDSLRCLVSAFAAVVVVVLGAVAPAGAQGKVCHELDALAM